MVVGDKHFVAIEGVIGVGKTCLVRRLAERLDARLILEQVEENPFLAHFYRDPERYAFQVQVFFLLSRFKQQQQIGQADVFMDMVVSDYMFAKDRIFARLNLDDQELVLYERIAEVLEKSAAQPDLVVYLQARTEVIMQRIKERGRSFEKRISREYIEALNEAYNRFFFTYTASPVLVVDTNKVDYRTDDRELERLIAKMAETQAGMQVWIPGADPEDEL
ncbi:MAG: deoxynucleoside kinase [Candidatus Eisenbacteria bacterium]|jgi:deoxyadenosine/deoxycytidine kinase|nr:deoxynucleoside kinase [Candidatus Eisenbacteria bacterium]